MGAVLTPVVRELAHRAGHLDHGLTSRKVHGRPIPRLGGIAMVVAFLAPLVALFFVNSEVGRRLWMDRQSALALILGGVAIAGLGIWDDLNGCTAKTKFAVQFAVAAGMYLAGFRVDTITHPFGEAIHLGPLAMPFTMLWIAGVINAVNLIDGLDGLAGGVAFIAVATIFTLAALRNEPLMLLFTAALGGSILGFLLYNFNPATIFMGDTGSMFLGFILAVTSIRTSSKHATAVAIAVPIMALGVPIADTLLAMGRRALRGAPLFSADRGHIHHRLLDLGLSHRGAVLTIYGAAATLGISALLLAFANGVQAAIVLTVLGLLGFGVLRALGYVDLAKAQAAMADRRRNLDMRSAVRRAGETLRQAKSPLDVWLVVREVAPAFGAVGVGLVLGRLEGRDGSGPWAEGLDGLPEEALRATYGLIPERPGDDHLELAWVDGRTGVHRDTEIAIELLCDHASTALERIERGAERASSARVVPLRRGSAGPAAGGDPT